MRKLYLYIALILFAPVGIFFIMRENVISSYDDFICRADFAELYFYDKNRELLKLNGALLFDFKHNRMKVSLLSEDKKPRWRGVVSFTPQRDFTGHVNAIVTTSVLAGMSTLSMDAGDINRKHVENNSYLFHRYPIEGHPNLFFLKVANLSGFCIRQQEIP